VVASRLAHDVMYHVVCLLSLKVVLTGFVVLVAICVAPLLALAGPLAAAKRRALLDYGALLSTQVPIKEVLKKITGVLL
jgi:hypothetical protein